MDENPSEVGDTIYAVGGGDAAEVGHGEVEDGDLMGLGIIAAVDEIALVFIAEVVAEDAFDPGAFLLDDQFSEVIVVHTGQVDVSMSVVGAGYELGG